MPCRISGFSGRKRERSPRENPPNGDVGGFSHGDLSPRQAKIRKTGGEKATHEKCRSFAWHKSATINMCIPVLDQLWGGGCVRGILNIRLSVRLKLSFEYVQGGISI